MIITKTTKRYMGKDIDAGNMSADDLDELLSILEEARHKIAIAYETFQRLDRLYGENEFVKTAENIADILESHVADTYGGSDNLSTLIKEAEKALKEMED